MMRVAASQLPLPTTTSPPSRRQWRAQPPPAAASGPPKALAAILRSRVIACLRAQDGETAMKAAHAAIRGGVTVLEIVMSTPGVLEVLEDLCRIYPSLTFGVGTVLNAPDARKAINAGAQFLMSPGTVVVYPVSVMGGEMYISALKKPFPLVPMIASQGIKISSIKGYMEAGASAVVLSDAIFGKELMGSQKFSEISELASLASLEALQSVK